MKPVPSTSTASQNELKKVDMKRKLSHDLVAIAFVLLQLFSARYSHSQNNKKIFACLDSNFATAQEACNFWLSRFPEFDKENPYAYKYPSASIIPGDSTYCGCRTVGRNSKGEKDIQEQFQLVYIIDDLDAKPNENGATIKEGTPSLAVKGEEGRSASSNGGNNSILPNIGEELSVPYKDARARAKVLDTLGRFVLISEKSKSASGDITHSIPKETFRAQLASKEIIRWTEERARLMANRPPYKNGLVETVWDKAKRPDGSVHDPAAPFERLEWVKGKSRYAQWHMGHVNDHQYSKLVDEFIDGKIVWDKFIEEYNKAENYAPELPIKNMRKGVNAEPKPQQ